MCLTQIWHNLASSFPQNPSDNDALACALLIILSILNQTFDCFELSPLAK